MFYCFITFFLGLCFGVISSRVYIVRKKNLILYEVNEFRDASEITINNFDEIFNNLLKVSNSICFLTAGKKECRSWIVKKESSAVDAAGKIHSDIARGFVRAEVINVEDLLKFSNEREAKEKGLIRGEGKNYIIKTGDVVNFLFSV